MIGTGIIVLPRSKEVGVEIHAAVRPSHSWCCCATLFHAVVTAADLAAGVTTAAPRRRTRPRDPARFADGDRFPQPEQGPSTPRIDTLPNYPEPELKAQANEDPATPVTTAKAGGQQSWDYCSGPAADGAAAPSPPAEYHLRAEADGRYVNAPSATRQRLVACPRWECQ
jgi:hypothetical protein